MPPKKISAARRAPLADARAARANRSLLSRSASPVGTRLPQIGSASGGTPLGSPPRPLSPASIAAAIRAGSVTGREQGQPHDDNDDTSVAVSPAVLGAMRLVPCTGCVRSALAGSSKGECRDQPPGTAGDRCVRCSHGHSCEPLPSFAESTGLELVTALQEGRPASEITRLRVATRFLLKGEEIHGIGALLLHAEQRGAREAFANAAAEQAAQAPVPAPTGVASASVVAVATPAPGSRAALKQAFLEHAAAQWEALLQARDTE